MHRWVAVGVRLTFLGLGLLVGGHEQGLVNRFWERAKLVKTFCTCSVGPVAAAQRNHSRVARPGLQRLGDHMKTT